MKPTDNNNVPREGLEALPTVADALSKVAEAMELFSEAYTQLFRLLDELPLIAKIRDARDQIQLANGVPANRTDIDNAIEVWSLPDDPLREELEALKVPHVDGFCDVDECCSPVESP